MVDVLVTVLFVVLVNGACILSFDRAQGAIRDLGAAWVRALSLFREPEAPAPPPDEPWRPEVRVRDQRVPVWVPAPDA